MMPDHKPVSIDRIPTADGTHELYAERHGNPKASRKAVVLHGGPGAGCSYKEHELFDPREYDVALFDQRWAPRSTPQAGIGPNSIDLNIADVETVRAHYGFETCTIIGGSWGATLGAFYAGRHKDHVERLILRNLFLPDEAGAAHIIEASGSAKANRNQWFDAYQNFIPAAERKHGLLYPYYERLKDNNDQTAEAARLFMEWDTSILTATPDPELIRGVAAEPDDALACARAFFHFARHEFRAKRAREMIDGLKDADFPIHSIIGGRDHICSPARSLQAATQWPNSTVHYVPEGGHGMADPLIRDALTDIIWNAVIHDRRPKLAPKAPGVVSLSDESVISPR